MFLYYCYKIAFSKSCKNFTKNNKIVTNGKKKHFLNVGIINIKQNYKNMTVF